MPSDIYIFGYQSMLAEGSLASTIGDTDEEYVPCRLPGHVRDWQAVRDFSNHPRKRYVHVADWRPAGRVAFATLRADPARQVNGLCRRIAGDQLAALDFREEGYRRIEVGDRLIPYPGHALVPSRPCYAYLDAAPADAPAPVSQAYYDMGRVGAQTIDRHVPGFAADYDAGTQPPAELADDLAFLFIGADGRHLWLLEESDSSLVLLLRFARTQFPASGDGAAELSRPVTPGLAWLDLRHRRAPPARPARVPGSLASVLAGEPDMARLAGSAHWLARLTACESGKLTADTLTTLATDPDPWVRRAARLQLGDPA